jgi:hypothetical protein
MVTSLLGGALLEPILSAPDYLANVYPQKAQVIILVLLELINCTAVIGIAAMLFPILKKHSAALAMGYVGFRVIEAAALVIADISPLSLISLSQQYLESGNPDVSSFQTLGTLLMAVRGQLTGLMVPIFFGLGALLLYYFLYRSRLLPRFISIWGFVAVVLVLALNLSQAFGLSVGPLAMLFALPIILNEVFLGIWLIAKGFSAAAAAEYRRSE